MAAIDLLNCLNEPQREAVMTVDGALLVLAGAGSGKTRVITHRLAYLVEAHEVWPSRILAVTFTNKAAGEMRDRVATLIGPEEAGRAWVGTFHATCVKILRREAKTLGINPSFTIYDASDQLRVVKNVLKALGLNDKQVHPMGALNEISRAKNRLESPEIYSQEARTTNDSPVVDVYREYQRILDANNALDFDDLLRRTVDGLREDTDLRARWQERFRYVMVDEYQDTNHAQFQLLHYLCEAHGNICVVGDDDQSIYTWRGADVGNILGFEKDWPNAKVVKLEENYRSTQHILTAANSVVANNSGRKPKTLWTQREEGEPLVVTALADEQDETRWVVDTMQQLRFQDDLPLKAFSIIYRTNAQSRVLEDALRRADIPYILVGGTRFYDRREVKDILAYLKLVINPVDDIAALRIINVPARGIGKTTVGRIQGWATSHGVSFLDAVRRVSDIPDVGAGAQRKVRAFGELMESLRAVAQQMEVPRLVEYVMDVTGYVQVLENEGTGEAQGRLENLEELVSAAAEFVERAEEVTLDAFLQGVALLSSVDALQDDGGTVTMMTMHSAKGLEYPVVFMTGMEEGMFPHNNALYGDGDLEEERRLCYVGMTRAMNRLFLSHAWQRRVFGTTQMQTPSRFLDELPREVTRFEGLQQSQYRPDAHASVAGHRGMEHDASDEWHAAVATHIPPARTADGYTIEYDDAHEAPATMQYRVGEAVEHATFGRGRVVEVLGKGPRQKIEVVFRGDASARVLRVKDAPIQRLVE